MTYLSTGHKEVMQRIIEILAQVEYLNEIRSDESELRLRALQPYCSDYVVVSLQSGCQHKVIRYCACIHGMVQTFDVAPKVIVYFTLHLTA